MAKNFRSDEEKLRIIAKFDQSGLSKKDFAKQEGFDVSSLYAWIRDKKDKKLGKATPQQNGFVQLPNQNSQKTYNVIMPGGIMVQVPLSELPAFISEAARWN